MHLLSTQPRDMHRHIREVVRLIHQYELQCYTTGEPDPFLTHEWLCRLHATVISSLDRPAAQSDDAMPEDRQLADTLALLLSQVDAADQNIALLEESSVKLRGLAYTSKALEREVRTAREMVLRSRESERRESRRVWIGLAVFVCVCCYIVVMRMAAYIL